MYRAALVRRQYHLALKSSPSLPTYSTIHRGSMRECPVVASVIVVQLSGYRAHEAVSQWPAGYPRISGTRLPKEP
jgi:hypothetical protein